MIRFGRLAETTQAPLEFGMEKFHSFVGWLGLQKVGEQVAGARV